jgi:hypothetical protein
MDFSRSGDAGPQSLRLGAVEVHQSLPDPSQSLLYVQGRQNDVLTGASGRPFVNAFKIRVASLSIGRPEFETQSSRRKEWI